MNDKTIEPLRTFVDCGETIKIEDTKREISEEETENINICEDMEREVKVEQSVDDLISIHHKTENSNICKDIKEEVKERSVLMFPLVINRS